MGRGSKVPSAIYVLTGVSGFACLVYQILWMRQAGLMLGSTPQAAAITLATFFGGLSAGGLYWGRRCVSMPNPLRTYAGLESGIAGAGAVLLLAPVIMPSIHVMCDDHRAVVAFAFAFTLLMVFPASFLMGGTLPVLGNAVIRSRETFGAATAGMYAANTAGAACGAFAAAFLLIWLWGVRLTCLTAMVASAIAAVLAIRLSQTSLFQDAPHPAGDGGRMVVSSSATRMLPHSLVVTFAFMSGFSLLAMEVVWTRMMARIHENSVYGFATVLIMVLVCLALGAWLASRLARSRMHPTRVLLWLFVLGGAALAVGPFVFMRITDGMAMLGTNHALASYVLRLFTTAAAAIAPACLPLGAVFPLLMKGEEPFLNHAGKSIGLLFAVNTAGAILGSLAAGFLLLEGLGLWPTVQLFAGLYLLLAIITPAPGGGATHAARLAAGVMMVLLFSRLSPSRLPPPSMAATGGKIIESWEGSDCTVTVVEKGPERISIRINSNYSLGSTDAYGPQLFQARIPLLAWPDTESIFFLGLGTGITAGEALNRGDFPRIRNVVACELSPNVVAASKKYFTGRGGGFDLTNGLYQDRRAKVIVGDGRNHLLANRERYSMVNADLFLPYRRGTGNLYSREHFKVVRERLEPGGVFVQWLPLYQISEREFGTIARTMIDVFPQVSLWRGNFQPGAEIAALVGHADLAPLPACRLDAEGDKRHAVEDATHIDMQELMLPINPQTITFFYGGNLTRAADLFTRFPPNTDDRPVIEFGSPHSLHRPSNADRPQFLEARFASLVDQLQSRTPPDEDPLLASRSAASRKLPLAGSAFHRGWIARIHGDQRDWMKEWQLFLDNWLYAEAAD